MHWLWVPSLGKESSVLTVHLPEGQKMEIVILYYCFPISDTLSVVHGFSTVLPHASVWGCVTGVLYQKRDLLFPLAG